MERVSHGATHKMGLRVVLAVMSVVCSVSANSDWIQTDTVDQHRAAFTDYDIGLIIERFIEINGGATVVSRYGLSAIEVLGGWLDVLADSPALAAQYTERLRNLAQVETRSPGSDERVVVAWIEQELRMPSMTRSVPMRYKTDDEDDEEGGDWLDKPGFQMGLGALIGASTLGFFGAAVYLSRLVFKRLHGASENIGDVEIQRNFELEKNFRTNEDTSAWDGRTSRSPEGTAPPLPQEEFKFGRGLKLITASWNVSIGNLKEHLLRPNEEADKHGSGKKSRRGSGSAKKDDITNSPVRTRIMKFARRGNNDDSAGSRPATPRGLTLEDAPDAFKLSSLIQNSQGDSNLINAIRYVCVSLEMRPINGLSLEDKVLCVGFVYAARRHLKQRDPRGKNEDLTNGFRALCSKTHDAIWKKALSSNEDPLAFTIYEWSKPVLPSGVKSQVTSPRELTRSGRSKSSRKHKNKSSSRAGSGIEGKGAISKSKSKRRVNNLGESHR